MYRLAAKGVIRLLDNQNILPDKSNPEWLEYQSWRAMGNKPLPYEPELEALELILDRQLSKVLQWRDSEHNKPISYLAHLFDADNQARENITGVIARLARGDGLPNGWVGWRTYNNEMLWANDTPEDVHEHLRQVSILIEDRKQSIYSQAWNAKEELIALYQAQDRQGLLDFTI